MSLTNGYDEITSQGKLKWLKYGMNLVITREDRNKDIVKGIHVVGYSCIGDIEGLKEYYKEQKLEMQAIQNNARKKEQKTFRLEEFCER